MEHKDEEYWQLIRLFKISSLVFPHKSHILRMTVNYDKVFWVGGGVVSGPLNMHSSGDSVFVRSIGNLLNPISHFFQIKMHKQRGLH